MSWSNFRILLSNLSQISKINGVVTFYGYIIFFYSPGIFSIEYGIKQSYGQSLCSSGDEIL